MARFPRPEADIRILVQNIIAGLAFSGLEEIPGRRQGGLFYPEFTAGKNGEN